jgi:hypothetical protein
MATEAIASRAVTEQPPESVPYKGDVVMVLDEDMMPPPPPGSRDVVMTLASELTPATVVTDSLPAVEALEPSPVAEVPGSFVTTEVAESFATRDTLTVEKVMELATCRYIDFPGVGVIDLEAPQLPEKVLEVAKERMFTEPSIMDTIASVSKALQEYERTGGFAPAVTVEVTDAAREEPAASSGPSTDALAPPPASEFREASLPQPAGTAEATVAAATTGVAEAVVGEAGSSPPRPVATEVNKVRALDEPTAVTQEQAAPERTVRVASPEIQEVEETGASLSQGVASDEVRGLELACTPWATVFESGDDSEDDEEVAMRNTLERGMNWVRRAFDELILPATSVSSLVRGQVLESAAFSGYAAYFLLVGGRPLSRQVGDVPTRCANVERSGLSWRRSSSWPGWQRLVPWRATRPRGCPSKLPAS